MRFFWPQHTAPSNIQNVQKKCDCLSEKKYRKRSGKFSLFRKTNLEVNHIQWANKIYKAPVCVMLNKKSLFVMFQGGNMTWIFLSMCFHEFFCERNLKCQSKPGFLKSISVVITLLIIYFVFFFNKNLGHTW